MYEQELCCSSKKVFFCFSLQGCYATVISAIKSNYPVFGGIIIAIALFPLIGVLLACCLARQMSKQRYEQVD